MGICTAPCNPKTLQEFLIEYNFDVPTNRLNDIKWLQRNIQIKNGDNPHIEEILKLLKQ